MMPYDVSAVGWLSHHTAPHRTALHRTTLHLVDGGDEVDTGGGGGGFDATAPVQAA